MKPEPAPLEGNVRDLSLAVMRKAKFPMLATIDGEQPRLRPVSPVRNDGFTVYVASMRSSHKTGEIDTNSKVELCYMDDDHDQVRITGVADRVRDRALSQELWDGYPLLSAYLGSIDNPELIIYRVTPRRVRFMREWALEYHEVEI